jgi:DNA replication protein DnaC
MEINDFLNQIRPPQRKHFECTDNHFERMRLIRSTVCPDFKTTSQIERIYVNGVKYFSNDTTCDWDINKGLYLYGVYGVGKTLFFKVMRYYLHSFSRGLVCVTSDDLMAEYAISGFEAIMKYCATKNHNGLEPKELMIDDLGQGANSVKFYGTHTNVMIEVLQRRYRVFTDVYLRTFISTNLEPKEIKELYGEYISSRMQEMFNVILFPGEDKRKK